MHRIHGLGLHRRAQTGRNSLRRDHIQGLDQDWPEQSEVSSEVSSPGRATDIASERGNVHQPGTKEELDGEEFSPAKTFVRARSKRARVPSRFILASRQRSSAGAS